MSVHQTEPRNPTDAAVVRACELVFQSGQQTQGLEVNKKGRASFTRKLPATLKHVIGYVALAHNLALDAFIAAVILFVDNLLVLSLVFVLSCARYEQAVFCNGTLIDAIQRNMCPLDADRKLCRMILPGFADTWGPGDHQVLRIGKLVGTIICLTVKIIGLCMVSFWKSSFVTSVLRALLQTVS